jgi:DNA-binding LacI/PurR family transcriptional regulator
MERGIREQSERAGFHVESFHLPEAGLRGERLSDILWNRGIVGVLLVAGHEANELLQGFDSSRFALATCSYGLSDPPLHRVCAHHVELMRAGVRYLMNSGARRVGVVLPAYLDEPVHIHKAAVRSVELEWGRRRICSLLDFEGDPDVFEAWMKKTNPDVLLAGTLGCARQLQSFGAGSGPNVASMETYPDAGLPGMCQDHPAQGAAMVDLLVGQLSRNESGVPAKPKTVLIPGYWVESAGG